MRLCVKKIYCPHCRKAVRGQEQLHTNPLRIVCSRCGRTICTSNGIYWHWPREVEAPPPPPRETPTVPEEKPKRTTRARKQAAAPSAPAEAKEKTG